MKAKMKTKITIKPTAEERNLAELIEVLKANIDSPRGQWPRDPDVFLTKGNMAYIVEILEQAEAKQ
jgi:hypothetical protein